MKGKGAQPVRTSIGLFCDPGTHAGSYHGSKRILASNESIPYSLSRDIKFILLQLAHMDKIEMKAPNCSAASVAK